MKLTGALTGEEIIRLVRALRRHNRYLDQLRLREPLARHIQRAKTPWKLSQSIVARALFLGKIAICTGATEISCGGGSGCSDLLIKRMKLPERCVEIKATGEQQFSDLSERDLDANVLAWVDLGYCLTCQQRWKVRILVFVRPNRHFKLGRVSLSHAEKLVARGIGKCYNLDLRKLRG